MEEAASVLRKGYEAYGRGDEVGVMSVLADDLVWHSLGRGPMAGDYKGKEELAAYFGKTAELSGGTFREQVLDVAGNAIRAFGLVVFSAERDGKALHTRSVHVADVEDGKITEFTEYFDDQHGWDEFWS